MKELVKKSRCEMFGHMWGVIVLTSEQKCADCGKTKQLANSPFKSRKTNQYTPMSKQSIIAPVPRKPRLFIRAEKYEDNLKWRCNERGEMETYNPLEGWAKSIFASVSELFETLSGIDEIDEDGNIVSQDETETEAREERGWDEAKAARTE